MAEDENLDLKGFGSKAVHSGTNHIGDAVNTPIFQSSTYKLTDERYAGWAAGAQHRSFMLEYHLSILLQ